MEEALKIQGRRFYNHNKLCFENERMSLKQRLSEGLLILAYHIGNSDIKKHVIAYFKTKH